MVGERTDNKATLAFRMLENTFAVYKNAKEHESNKKPSGHPDRIEHDLSEIEKSHLNLLTTHTHVGIAEQIIKTINKNSEESANLANKVFWLNIAITILTAIMAISTVLELFQ